MRSMGLGVALGLVLAVHDTQASCMAVNCLCPATSGLEDVEVLSEAYDVGSGRVRAVFGDGQGDAVGQTVTFLLTGEFEGATLGSRVLVSVAASTAYGGGALRYVTGLVDAAGTVSCVANTSLSLPVEEAPAIALRPDCAAETVIRGFVVPDVPCNDCGGCRASVDASVLALLGLLSLQRPSRKPD